MAGVNAAICIPGLTRGTCSSCRKGSAGCSPCCKSLGLSRLAGQNILEMGCYTGYWLGEFVKWGARPENLTGIDLFAEYLVRPGPIQAPGVGLVQANAAYLPFLPCHF